MEKPMGYSVAERVAIERFPCPTRDVLLRNLFWLYRDRFEAWWKLQNDPGNAFWSGFMERNETAIREARADLHRLEADILALVLPRWRQLIS